MSTIRTAYNTLENLLDIFYLIRKLLGTTVKIQTTDLLEMIPIGGRGLGVSGAERETVGC
jgi:hypothetical protein